MENEKSALLNHPATLVNFVEYQDDLLSVERSKETER